MQHADVQDVMHTPQANNDACCLTTGILGLPQQQDMQTADIGGEHFYKVT